MKKTRISIVLGGFAIGGAENMVFEQIKKMNTDRFCVNVLCCSPKKNNALEAAVEKLVPVTYLTETGRSTPGSLIRVLKALRKQKPDVVHTHLGGNGFGAIWSILFGKPLVITVHTTPQKAFTAKVEKLVRQALRKGKTRLVAVSEENAKAVKAYFGLDDKKCVFVNNGIDLDRFYRSAHENVTIIHVGRQDDNKNQAALIRCFARLREKEPNVKLLLLGDGPNHGALAQLAKELNVADAVTLTGNVSNTEDYYAVSDLYVQCSHREAMPLCVLEAMAAGLPIVSTDVGGLRDVVQDNGILVPDNNEEALYQAIETIYRQTPEEAAARQHASGRLVQGYSSQAMARAYEDIYKQMC